LCSAVRCRLSWRLLSAFGGSCRGIRRHVRPLQSRCFLVSIAVLVPLCEKKRVSSPKPPRETKRTRSLKPEVATRRQRIAWHFRDCVAIDLRLMKEAPKRFFGYERRLAALWDELGGVFWWFFGCFVVDKGGRRWLTPLSRRACRGFFPRQASLSFSSG
jgi:hypothetical protein